MNWRFWRTEPEYIEDEEARPKRKAETLKSVSEKLLIRRMKKQPDTFGIEVAQRTMGVSKDEGIAELMKQMRELRKFEGEFGSKGGGESWLKQLGSGIAEGFAPVVADIIQNIAAKQPKLQPRPQLGQQPTLQQGQPEEAPQQQPEPQVEPQVEPEEARFSLEHINEVLNLSPKQAVIRLEQYNADWLSLLSDHTYETFIEAVRLWPKNELTTPLIDELLKETRKEWIEEVLAEAKQAVEGQ